MLRRPKRSKNEVVVPKEEEDIPVVLLNSNIGIYIAQYIV
jgi:hypothetical protein